jgi:hypothetical protein
MSKEKIISEIGSPILFPLGVIQILFLLIFFSSPFILIWHSWEYAWKTGLTGLLGIIIIFGLYKFVKNLISETIDEIEKEEYKNKPKSNFQKKLEELRKQYEQ